MFAGRVEFDGPHGDGDSGEDDHQVGVFARIGLRRSWRQHHRPQHARRRHCRRGCDDPGNASRVHHRRRSDTRLLHRDGSPPVQNHDFRQPDRRDRARCRDGVPRGAESEQRRHLLGHLALGAALPARRCSADDRALGVGFLQDTRRGTAVADRGGLPGAPRLALPTRRRRPCPFELRAPRGLGDRGRGRHGIQDQRLLFVAECEHCQQHGGFFQALRRAPRRLQTDN
mmetsp:Transcript_68585/g.198665  ORF Transcript_68585/g.198665 Transcript_68585/m.198665 type:complete len:228 (-) Transcript_68585:783-1466(-)